MAGLIRASFSAPTDFDRANDVTCVGLLYVLRLPPLVLPMRVMRDVRLETALRNECRILSLDEPVALGDAGA